MGSCSQNSPLCSLQSGCPCRRCRSRHRCLRSSRRTRSSHHSRLSRRTRSQRLPIRSSRYNGYIPTVTHDGFLLDTPEVAHAKANHFALYNQAAHAAAVAPDTDVYYAHDAAPAHVTTHAYHAAPAVYAPAVYGHHAAYNGYIPTVAHDG